MDENSRNASRGVGKGKSPPRLLSSCASTFTKTLTPTPQQQLGGIHGPARHVVNSGGSEVSTASKRTITVCLGQVRLLKAPNGGVLPRTLYLQLLFAGNQVMSFKSTKFLIDAKGHAVYIFEQRSSVQVFHEQYDAVNGVEMLLLSTSGGGPASSKDVVIAAATVPYTNTLTPAWVTIFAKSVAGLQQQSYGEVFMTIDARDLSENFLSDSESEGSLTPMPGSLTPVPGSLTPVPGSLTPYPPLAASANLMQLTATGCKESDTPMPTPSAKLEPDSRQSSPSTAGGGIDALKDSTEKVVDSTNTGQLPIYWPLFLMLIFLTIIFAKVSLNFFQARGGGGPANPPVRMMNHSESIKRTASGYEAFKATGVPPITTTLSAPQTGGRISTHRPNTLVVSAPHGKLIQIIDGGSDGYCLHWRRGLFGGYARFQECSDRR